MKKTKVLSIFQKKKKKENNSFRSIETGFFIESTDNGHVTFQAASNGKYIIPHATGHMRAIGDQLVSIESYFLLKFVNRPFCVFKCDFGYVAHRNKHSRILECNKSVFTLFTIEELDDQTDSDGFVYLKGLIKIFLCFFFLLYI